MDVTKKDVCHNVKGLKFLLLNADSIGNKKQELVSLASDLRPDVIAITELLSKKPRSDSGWEPVIDGYVPHFNKAGLGVGMYVKSYLNVVRDEKFEVFSPSVFCTITHDEELKVGIVYRSPNSNPEDNEKLNDFVSLFFAGPGNKVLIGDFNYPDIEWEHEVCNKDIDHPASKFFKIIQDNFAVQFIIEPTHYRSQQTANILDLVFANRSDLVSNVLHHPPIGKSHHSCITFEVDFGFSIPNKSKGKRYFFNKGNFEKMRQEFEDMDWKVVLDSKSVDETWLCISEKIKELQEKHIPSNDFIIWCNGYQNNCPFFCSRKHEIEKNDI